MPVVITLLNNIGYDTHDNEILAGVILDKEHYIYYYTCAMGTLSLKGYSMFPHEMLILMAISSAGNAGTQILNKPHDIASEYIGYQYNSLVKRGYLKKHSKARYSLTQKGNALLSQFLYNNNDKANETIVMLDQIGIDTSQTANLLSRKQRNIG